MDFPFAAIEINTKSNNWGPFAFDFTPSVPSGDTVSSATVGSVLVTTGVSSTSVLIEAGSTSCTGNIVSIKLQYPGSSYVGQHRLLFDITLVSTAVHRFTFGYVYVTAD